MKQLLAIPALLATLSACGGGGTAVSNGFEQSAITDPVLASSISATFTGVSGTLAVTNSGGFEFDASVDEDGGALLTSDLLPATPALTAPTAGSASMSGKWALGRLSDVEQSMGGTWSGNAAIAEGDITLLARFGSGTLTGTGDGLTVDGTIADSELGGTVSYDGVSGDLQGTIGGTGAIGIFVGGTGGDGIAGGFAVAK